MSKIPVLNAVRLIARETSYLDRRVGSRGEVYFDRDAQTLRIYDGDSFGGLSLAKSDLSNVSNSNFLAKANAVGIGAGAGGSFSLSVVGDDSTLTEINQESTLSILGGTGISTTTNPGNGELIVSNSSLGFYRVSVSGQSNIEASTLQDTINFQAGSNISITTNAETKTITITSLASGQGTSSYSFNISGDDSTVRTVSNDQTIKFIGGSNIDTATDIDGNVTISAGGLTLSSLTDTNDAGLTVDEIYLPAITRLDVGNSGTSAYTFDQYVGNNPTIYAINGTTIAFKLLASGHPFLIQNGSGVNYNTGLVHVSTAGVVSLGASAQGKDSGTLYWKIPDSISGGYRYQCGIHGSMVGSISIKNFGSI